jgi:hypothetical protein
MLVKPIRRMSAEKGGGARTVEKFIGKVKRAIITAFLRSFYTSIAGFLNFGILFETLNTANQV